VLCPVAPLLAYSVEALDVTHEGETYSVNFDVRIDADADRARDLLADYRQWPKISRTITETRLLRAFPDGRQRISATLESCIAFIFCTTLRQVKDLGPAAGVGSFRAELVEGEGDFSSGWELWEIAADAPRSTRLRYRARLVPSFTLPPLVGPWLLKRELRRELLGTAAAVEKLLAD
jgi:hypothetical protein